MHKEEFLNLEAAVQEFVLGGIKVSVIGRYWVAQVLDNNKVYNTIGGKFDTASDALLAAHAVYIKENVA